MNKLTEIEQLIGIEIQANNLSNLDIIKLIELCGSYLNLATIPNYCKREGISYNGAKKHRNVVKMFNVKFVVDND